MGEITMMGWTFWKVLKIAVLGLLLWSVSLVWPEINLLLVAAGVVGLNLAFNLAGLLAGQAPQTTRPAIETASRPTRPVPLRPV